MTRAEDIAATVRLAFQIATSGRPGPVLIDITKDAQQASAAFDFEAAAPPKARPHPMLPAALHADSPSIREAVALIAASARPVILGRARHYAVRR